MFKSSDDSDGSQEPTGISRTRAESAEAGSHDRPSPSNAPRNGEPARRPELEIPSHASQTWRRKREARAGGGWRFPARAGGRGGAPPTHRQGPSAPTRAGHRPRAQNQAARPRGFRPGPGSSPDPAGPSPHLTGFLGILDLHGGGLRGEGRPGVRCAEEGGGGDSGGGSALRGGPAGSTP